MTPVEAGRDACRERVASLLQGPFSLLGAFVKNHDVSSEGELVLDLQGPGFDQFYGRCQLLRWTNGKDQLDEIRAFLRAAETMLSRKIRGVLWAPHGPPVEVGATVTLELAGVGRMSCQVVEVDREKDRITLERQESP